MSVPTSVNYPASQDTNLTLFGNQTNQISLPLAVDLNNSDTNIYVSENVTTLNYPQLFVFSDDGEVVYATGYSGSSVLIVERGVLKSPTSHPVSGSPTLILTMFADYINQLRGAIYAIEGELGNNPSASSGSSTVASRLTLMTETSASLASDITEISGSLTNLQQRPFAINVVVGDGSSVPSAKLYVWVKIPFSGTLTANEIYADTSGSISIDVWKTSYANIPMEVGDSICGSNYITLVAQQANRDTTLTSWTKTFTAGDWLGFYVNSATLITQATVTLIGTVTS